MFQKSTTDFVLQHPDLGKNKFSVSEKGMFEQWFKALSMAVDIATL